jgi:hypothetical protein
MERGRMASHANKNGHFIACAGLMAAHSRSWGNGLQLPKKTSFSL